MKNRLLSLLAVLLLAVFNFTSSFAQDELWGVTAGFGPRAGSVFSLKSDGTAFTTRKTFDNEAKTINGKLTLGVDGKLYGVSYEGGNPGNGGGDFPSYGTAFRVNVDGSNFTILHYFNKSTDGSHPYGGIISGGDGYFYGRTRDGGPNDAGTLFKIKADGSDFMILKNFTDPFFEFLIPQDGLTLGADGKIYGANMGGGTNHNGTIFRINRDGSDFTVLRHLFDDTDGAFPSGGLTPGSDGKFYGIARIGGMIGIGTIFRINSDGSGFTVLKHMNGDEEEVFPDGGLTMGPDGKLYGMTQGSDNNGTIFRINPDGSGFAILRKLNKYSDGANPQGELTFGTDGKLYGTTSEGGLSDKGTLFRINTDGSSFTILKQFGLQLDGGAPQGGLTRSTTGKLYGTTGELGLMNAGTIFQLNSDGNGFIVLKHLGTAAEGSFPQGGLAQGTDGKFYGTTPYGGSYGGGIIYRINSDGRDFTVLKNFTATISEYGTQSRLVQGKDGKFYGINSYGGTYGKGTIYRINPDGSGFTVLRHLDSNADGHHHAGGLVQGSDGSFYGMTSYGGTYNNGTIFRINPDGTSFLVLKHISDADGAGPNGGLTLGTDGKLYGLTGGAVIRINQDGSEFMVLRKFNRTTEGFHPFESLIQGSDGRFYGITSFGPGTNYYGGTIFGINHDGSGFTVLHDLDPVTEGGYTFSGLLQGTDGSLYGMTSRGGTHDAGTIFRIKPDGSNFIILRHLNPSVDGAAPFGNLVIKKALVSTPPTTLVSTSPARNAVSAARNANLALAFSQAMNAATASKAAVKVYGSQTGLRSGSFSGGGTATVTLDPTKDFYAGEKVSVSVTKNARSTSGDSLNKAQVLQFTAATAPASAIFAQKAGPAATRATADVDGDGDVDLIVLGPAAQQVSVQLNDGKGNFTPGATITLAQTPELVAMADLDGDGDSDMAVSFSTGTSTPGGVSIYLNNGTGQFTSNGSYAMPWRPTDVKAGDFDGDGDLDLAVPAPNPSDNDYDGTYVYGFVHILFNNGSAGFPRRTATLEAGEGTGGWDVGDVDGDGDLDLLGSSTNVTSGACLVYLNDGQGEFTFGQYLQTGRRPSGNLVDLDGDGDLDVASIDIGSPEEQERRWQLYINNGTGNFQFKEAVFLGTRSSVGFTVGDFDGDGDADLAAAQTDPNLDFGLGPDTLVVFVNDGSANFSVRKSPIRSGESRLYRADLDGDGDLDLIGGQRLFFNGGLPVVSTVTVSSFAPMSAPVGAGVAIRGTNFTAGSTVRFNGVAATQVSFESPTLLIATVPAGANSGSIQVSNANGSATSAGSLTVAAVTSLWQAKSALPTARTQHGAVALSSNGRVYAFGGTNGAELSSLEIYNTNAFSWSAGAAIPTATRGAAFVRGTDNQIYLFSGYGGGSNRSQCYKYNPSTNTWTTLANLPTPVWAASAAANGDLIYVFGGQTAAGTASNGVQIYNTQTNAWTSGAVMPVALMQHQAVRSYNGKIYLFGGRTTSQGGLSDKVQVYNPANNSWSTAVSMPVPKAQFGVVLNNDGRIFVVGGRSSYVPNQGPFFHSVEIFDPKTNSWSEGPALPSAVGGQTLVNSYGNLFMMGGIDGNFRNYNWRLVLPPVAPTSAKATAVSSSQVKVEWVDAAGNENRYEVERSLSANGPWAVIATTAANAITHTDGGRAANKTYFYRVRGGNSAGYGAYSPTVSATTWASGAAARESVEEEAVSLQLQAAPNPFSSTTTVTFTAQESGLAVLDLYDLHGQKLHQVFNAQVQAGESQKAEVNGSRLGQGLYLLRLVNGSHHSYLKLLIEK